MIVPFYCAVLCCAVGFLQGERRGCRDGRALELQQLRQRDERDERERQFQSARAPAKQWKCRERE